MKNRTLLFGFLFIFVFYTRGSLIGTLLVCLGLLAANFVNIFRHLVIILISLEIIGLFLLGAMAIVGLIIKDSSFIYMFMILAVGEGVIGLSLLVKCVRRISSELVRRTFL